MSDQTDALYFSERRLWEDGDKPTREVLERLARYRASLDRTVIELAALRKGLQDEVEHYSEAIEACEEGGFAFTTAHAARARLQALLNSSGEEK